MNDGEDEIVPTASQQAALSFQMNVLVEPQPDGNYLAHCLELDLVAEGATLEAACEELLNVIDVQIRTCLENDNLENLYFPAPSEVWQKFGRAKERRNETRQHRTIATLGRQPVELDQFCYV